jgi:hypothetical protein
LIFKFFDLAMIRGRFLRGGDARVLSDLFLSDLCPSNSSNRCESILRSLSQPEDFLFVPFILDSAWWSQLGTWYIRYGLSMRQIYSSQNLTLFHCVSWDIDRLEVEVLCSWALFFSVSCAPTLAVEGFMLHYIQSVDMWSHVVGRVHREFFFAPIRHPRILMVRLVHAHRMSRCIWSLNFEPSSFSPPALTLAVTCSTCTTLVGVLVRLVCGSYLARVLFALCNDPCGVIQSWAPQQSVAWYVGCPATYSTLILAVHLSLAQRISQCI